MQNFPVRAPRFLATSMLGATLLWPGTALAQQTSYSRDAAAIAQLQTNIREHQIIRNYARQLAERSDADPAEAEHHRQVAERHDRLAELDQRLLDYIDEGLREALARENLAPLVGEYSSEQDAQRQGYDTASQRLDQVNEGGARGQRFAESRARDSGVVIADGRSFHRVIVDSTGDVIVNDRADVIEAKLEDLGRRQEELARASKTTGAAAQKRIRAELAALDREIMAVLDKLARNGAAGPRICAPANTTYAILGCDYLAQNVPITIPRGDEPIVIDKAVLSITEHERGPWQWSFTASYRQGQARGTLASSGALKLNADGINTMLNYWTDEDGNRQARKIPLRIDMRTGQAEGIQSILGLDGPLPRLNLTFRRDPANFPPDQRPDLRLPTTPTQQPGRNDAPLSDDEMLAPLVKPDKATPAKPAEPDPARGLLDEAGREVKRRAGEAARGLLRGKLF